MNIKHTSSGLFAHVVTGNVRTYAHVKEMLVESGMPKSAINLRSCASRRTSWRPGHIF